MPLRLDLVLNIGKTSLSDVDVVLVRRGAVNVHRRMTEVVSKTRLDTVRPADLLGVLLCRESVSAFAKKGMRRTNSLLASRQ